MRIHIAQLLSMADQFKYFDFTNLSYIDFNKALKEKDKFQTSGKFYAMVKFHEIIMNELTNPNVYKHNVNQIITIMDSIKISLDTELHELQVPKYKHFVSCIINDSKSLLNPPSYASLADLRSNIGTKSKAIYQTYNFVDQLLNLNTELYSLINFVLTVQTYRFNLLQQKVFSRLKQLRPTAYHKYNQISQQQYMLSVHEDIVPFLFEPDSEFYIHEEKWVSYFETIRSQIFAISGIDSDIVKPYYDQHKFPYNQQLADLFFQKYPNQLDHLSHGNPRRLNWLNDLMDFHVKSERSNQFFIASLVRDKFWNTSNCFKWNMPVTQIDYEALDTYFELPENIYSLLTYDKLLKPESLTIPIHVYRDLESSKINAYETNLYLLIRHAQYIANHKISNFSHGKMYSFRAAIIAYCRSLLTLYGHSLNFQNIVVDIYKHFDVLVTPIYPDIAKRFEFFNNTKHQTYYYADLLIHKHINYVLKVHSSEGEAKLKAQKLKQKLQEQRHQQNQIRNLNYKLSNDMDFRNEFHNSRIDDKRKNTGSRASNDRTRELNNRFLKRANPH